MLWLFLNIVMNDLLPFVSSDLSIKLHPLLRYSHWVKISRYSSLYLINNTGLYWKWLSTEDWSEAWESKDGRRNIFYYVLYEILHEGIKLQSIFYTTYSFLGWQQETRVSREIPHMHMESMQTPHIKALSNIESNHVDVLIQKFKCCLEN